MTIIPLRNIALRIVVEEVEITGEIVFLVPNGMSVQITSPVAGLGTGLNVPHFAMYRQNWLATLDGRRTVAITDRGRQRAEWLLLELHNYSRGKRSGWGVSSIGPDGWTDIVDG